MDPKQFKRAAWRSFRSGLDQASTPFVTPADVLRSSGWARSVGGANAYTTGFSRGDFKRGVMDKAASSLSILELPAARGCTYVVTEDDFHLALAVSQSFGEGRTLSKVSSDLGLTEGEIDKLGESVCKLLQSGPLTPQQLKELLGAQVRNFGDAGKKKGVTTSLPISLGRLQSRGQIRKEPLNGRFDSQRYQYVNWMQDPIHAQPEDGSDLIGALMVKYFEWIGCATLKQFQAFSGSTVKVVQQSASKIGLLPDGEDHMLQSMKALWDEFEVSPQPNPKFVSALDSLVLLRRTIGDLIEPRHQNTRTLKGLNGLAELPHHAIVDRGLVIGFWEFDKENDRLEWVTLDPPNDRIREVAATFESWIREDLGDCRSFSLDSPAGRRKAIDSLLALRNELS